MTKSRKARKPRLLGKVFDCPTFDLKTNLKALMQEARRVAGSPSAAAKALGLTLQAYRRRAREMGIPEEAL